MADGLMNHLDQVIDEVPRVETMSPAELDARHLTPTGSSPVVLTGLARDWPALTTWSFAGFAERYGSDRVLVTDFLGSSTLHKVPLRDYLAYVADPATPFLPGVSGTAPWYSPYWTPFVTHPELLADFDVSSAINSWLPPAAAGAAPGSDGAVMAEWALRGFSWLFVGPAGTVTPRHVDTLNTHAWNTQICGRKRFDLWAPHEGPAPAADEPPALTVTLEPGETLIIPAEWSHSVVSLAPSISLTANFFNQTNCAAFLRTIYTMPDAWRSKGRIVPALAADLAR
jgi:hypothetical protein